MTALIVAAVIIVTLYLLGRSRVERLRIVEPKRPIDKAFSTGRNRVEYQSLGKTIVGDLFISEDYAPGEKRPAIVVAPPGTSVKEQAAGFYAEKLSKRGYITLAFDTRGIGESEGTPGDANPYVHANDVASSVSFISSLPQVDTDKLFNVGVCAGVVSAAFETFQDDRIKALGMVVPSITGSELTRGTNPIVRSTIYVVSGVFVLLHALGLNLKTRAIPPEDKLENAPAGMDEVATYYPEGKRGHHPRWINAVSATSLPGIASLHIFDYANKFAKIPVFMATGAAAYSYEPAVRFYDALKGPKESLVIDDANHVEFYWKDAYADKAVDGIDRFFKEHG